MWEGGSFLGALTPKFYVALTGTSSLISGLILIFEWWYFRKYGTSFIEQVSLAPWLGGAGAGAGAGAERSPRRARSPGAGRSPPRAHRAHAPGGGAGAGAECKVWCNPMSLLRGAEYGRLWGAARRPPLTYYDMNLSAQDHQAWFSGGGGGGGGGAEAEADEAEAAMARAWREREPAARVAAARRALALRPACAPALLLLAEEEAPTVLEAERALRRAARAAEAALRGAAPGGAAARRAAAVLAHARRRAAMCARRLGRLRDAARQFRELVREAPAALQALATHENLLEVLLEQRLYGDALGVVARCEDAALPPSAALLYTAALLRARAAAAAPPRAAADIAALEAMRRAVEFNPYVPAYLLEQRALALPPEHVVRRGDSEALAYAFWHLRHWRPHEPALRLLRAAAEAARAPAAARARAAGEGCARCADRELLAPRAAPPRRALPAALLCALLAALALCAHRWPEPRALLRLLALV